MAPIHREAPRVLITDDPHPIAAKILAGAGFKVTQVRKLSAKELAEIGAYDALLVRGSEIKDPSFFAEAKRLRVIARAGTGYDNIDRDLATRHNVLVMNAPDGNAPAAAELTMAHMLNLARQVAKADGNMHQGTWDRTAHNNDFQLRNKTLGIIGLGRIGSLVAQYAKSFQMNIVAYDPYIPAGKAERLGARRVGYLCDLLRAVDIVTLHPDLNRDTCKMINAETLALCKKGVFVVNCARGPMIDAKALADAIRSGRVAGAALDVIADEPTKGDDAEKWKENPLFLCDRVTFTPHLGGTTKESLEDVARQAAEQIVAYLHEGIIANAVNELALNFDDPTTDTCCALAIGCA